MQKNEYLWYQKPASSFEEALPLGNGSLGVMVYGGARTNSRCTDRMSVNLDTLWYREEKASRNNPDALSYLKEIRSLLFAGKVREAERLSRLTQMSCPKEQAPYLPLCELHLTLENHEEEPEQYCRGLNLRTAVASVDYVSGGVHYRREAFVSAADNVLVIRITADRPGSVLLYANLTRRPYQGRSERCGEDSVKLSGKAGPDGVRYQAILQAGARGGTVCTLGDYVVVDGADEAVLLLSGATDFYGAEALSRQKTELDRAAARDYEELMRRHVEEYQHYYSRFELRLAEDTELTQLPTDVRLQRMREGGEDPGLVQLYCDYGRYLLISSSRPGTMAANLQGIWNESFTPPWESKYTININTEMNYWPACPTGLSECELPLFDLVERAIPQGREIAKRLYGCRGFVFHNNLDGWGDCGITGEVGTAAVWPMGGAWLALHYWDYYQFTQDQAFLELRAYPVIREACLFFVDYLTESPDGYLVTGPSLSPENSYLMPDGVKAALTMGPTMDSEILRELFSAFLGLCETLSLDDCLSGEVRVCMEKLPPIQIGTDGRILEWREEYSEPEPGHRHISHLFALHPGTQISPERTPELAAAAEATLRCRIENGGGYTGWSCAWIINFWARLGQGNMAYSFLRKILEESTMPNLLDNHPPFQIDGNFGALAAVTEMLLQSHQGFLHILPALPDHWSCGEVRGICARGGMKGTVSWKDGRLTMAEFAATGKEPYMIACKDQLDVSAGSVMNQWKKGSLYYYSVCPDANFMIRVSKAETQ